MVNSANARKGGEASIVMVCAVALLCNVSTSLRVFQVCQSDRSCKGFPLRGQPNATTFDDGEDEDDLGGMTCYTGGETVFNNHQFCDVTSKHTIPTCVLHPKQFP